MIKEINFKGVFQSFLKTENTFPIAKLLNFLSDNDFLTNRNE